MTERQEQALRGLLLAERALDERARAVNYTPHPDSLYFAAGTVAGYVSDELPQRQQHGNGAKDGRSWSGSVPRARFMIGALRALDQAGLAESHWPERARSHTYRLTEKGRVVAEKLQAAKDSAS